MTYPPVTQRHPRRGEPHARADAARARPRRRAPADVFPVVLGSGRRLFADGAADRKQLTLADVNVFDSGVAVHTYRPAREEPLNEATRLQPEHAP